MLDPLTLLAATFGLLAVALALAALSTAFYAAALVPRPTHHVLRLTRYASPITHYTLPSWLLPVEAAALGLAAPFLWFPTVRPQGAALALILLLAVWLVAALTGSVLWPRSRFDLALFLLLLMAVLGALHSQVPVLTLSKVTGLLLGLACYRVVVAYTSTPRAALLVLYLMAGLALAFSLVGLAAGELRTDKIPGVGPYRSLLPRYLDPIPETQGGVVSTNQLGGVLLYVLPLLSAVLCGPRRRLHAPFPGLPGRLFLSITAILLLVVLVFTQSRGAWAGMFLGALCILSLRWPWGRWVAILCLALPMLAWLLRVPLGLSPLFASISAGLNGPTALGSFAGRLQLWTMTVSVIRASPWVGGGLGTFRVLGIEGLSTSSIYDLGVPHAHNVFLQMAFDVGLPGVVAYLALLFLAFSMAWRAYRTAQGFVQSLAIGCLAALLASTAYGMADVVALGAKPGVLWWGLLALVAGLDRVIGLKDDGPGV